MDYPGGFITKTAPTLNPALGNAAPGVWRLNDVLKNIKAGTWPGYDPYFDYTTLLLHGNGTNGGQNNTFLDSSTNNFTITRNGNTTQGTFSPFSQTGWSNYFDGNGDYITAAASSDWSFTGNFTIECWIFPTTLTSTRRIISHSGTSGPDSWVVQSDGTSLNFYYATYPSFFTATSALTLNQWQHIAIVRSGSTITIYVNGVSKATATVSATVGSGSYGIAIGSNTYLTYPDYYNGYISNLRIVKGTAVYTSAFTPPTGPLTAITNTVFLTCQANRFVDSNTQVSAKTLTPAGNTSVQAFSPFAPTAVYSASTVGGSGYFDGTGDYLSVANNAAFKFGTGDFTVEFMLYSNVSLSGAAGGMGINSSTNGSWAWIISGGNLYWQTDMAQSNLYSNSTASLKANEWNHIAIVRSSGTNKMYFNGVVQPTTAADSTNYAGTGALNIGLWNTSDYINGYLTNLRLVKGTAVYTSNFTPPTAPLTNITNTSLLLNFTNAAIIDNTAKNVLETVGNAQISTSVSKFGGGSMAFDGNGDYLLLPNTPDFALRTGNFTLEFWINFSSISNYQTIYSYGYITSGDLLIQTGNGNGRMVVYVSGSAVITESGTATTGTWIHYALVRNGTTLTLYRDGTSSGSATNSADITTSEVVGIGANPLNYGGNPPGTYSVNGYIDDLRITKGIARYTSNFTPQTSQWQDQ